MINEYENELRPNWVDILLNQEQLLAIVEEATCLDIPEARKVLPATEWEVLKAHLLELGADAIINYEATIITTEYAPELAYVVWLQFSEPDEPEDPEDSVTVADESGDPHEIDIKIAVKDPNGTLQLRKNIDQRSPKCSDIYTSILNTSAITPEEAALIKSSGPDIYPETCEEKIQHKINSAVAVNQFIGAVSFFDSVKATVVDEYLDCMFRGNSGKLADVEVAISEAGSTYVKLIDLKLTDDRPIDQQAMHNAELLIGYKISTGELEVYRVFGEPDVENLSIFKDMLDSLQISLDRAAYPFLKINSVDETTGEVDFEIFTRNE